MEQQEKVKSLLFSAIDEVNQDLPEDERVIKSVETFLVGHTATTDSLTLIDLIVKTEKLIEKEFGAVISLAEENSVFSEGTTVGTLIDHICNKLKTK
jgi:acyl carrier protein